MLISEILERRPLAVSTREPLEEAERALTRSGLSLVPVVTGTEGVWAGNLYRHDLLSRKDPDGAWSESVRRDEAVLHLSQHLFEAARLMLHLKLDTLPVVGADFHYEGFVTRESVQAQIVRLLNLEEPGQVLFVELEAADFTLAQIIRFIEEEHARILGMLIEPPDAARPTFRISIKINKVEAGRIVSSLQRHGYTVTTPNQEEWLDSDFGHRADELLHFLEM